jgi:hypothetical protein
MIATQTPYPSPLFPFSELASLNLMIVLATLIVAIVLAGAWAALRRLRRTQINFNEDIQKEL